jgi:hypothetical protein
MSAAVKETMSKEPYLSLALVLFSTTRLMRLSIFWDLAISGEVRVS